MKEDTQTDTEALAELTEHVGKLGDVIEELKLGGPEDGAHVCEIAALKLLELSSGADERLDQLQQKLSSAATEVSARFAEAGLDALVVPDDSIATMGNLVTTYKHMESERDTALAELAAVSAKAEASALKDAKLAKASPAPRRDGGARAIGPLKGKKAEEALSGAKLIAAIEEAETVEVVFSDGKREIGDLAPLLIAGDAWVMSLDRVKLNVPELLVHGPGVGKPQYSVAGYGLLLDDELVAYAKRGDVLTIGANAQVNLKDDIVF